MSDAMDGNSADSQSELREVLDRLYRRRFSAADLRDMRGVWKVLVEQFFQRRIDPAATVLDVGAGACLFINHVRAQRRIALDANPSVVTHAAAGVETLVTDDLTLREIPDGTIGHAFVSNFLEHLPDHLAVLGLLRALFRKLRPGGSVMVLQPNFRLAPRRYFDFVDHRVILTDASLVEALEVAGFEIRELRARFLPFTSKSAFPRRPWMVALYLRVRPAQWLFGAQTFVRAVKPPRT